MPSNRFDVAFRRLRQVFTAQTKRAFLNDIRGQLEEDEDIQTILLKTRAKPRFLAVTVDRRKNDVNFSYNYFDLVLVALDTISGGHGIYKPLNQIRALRWNASMQDLLTVLNFFAQNNAQVRYRRALVLPFPTPPVGQRIYRSIYKK